MSESNPHAGTGKYRCDECGETFPWVNHQSTEANKACDEHVRDEHADLLERTW